MTEQTDHQHEIQPHVPDVEDAGWDSDLEARSGISNQESIASAARDEEPEHYYSPHDDLEDEDDYTTDEELGIEDPRDRLERERDEEDEERQRVLDIKHQEEGNPGGLKVS